MSNAPRSRPLEAVIRRVGQRRRPFTDLFAFLLTASWTRVILSAAAGYVLINAIFAGLYLLVPGSIANAHEGSFADAFFFSVQTLATIGYGFMYAKNTYGNVIVTIEAFVSIFVTAMFTGIVFAKFARPHARVLFSTPLVVQHRAGKPTLSFRVANERGNDVVEATIRVSALKTLVEPDGNRLRRFFELRLDRTSTPIFALSWQIFHPIDEDSPIYGMSPQDLIDQDVRLVVALTGFDGTFMQTIHARHLYWGHDIRWGHRFVDMIRPLPDSIAEMDFRKLDLTEPEREAVSEKKDG